MYGVYIRNVYFFSRQSWRHLVGCYDRTGQRMRYVLFLMELFQSHVSSLHKHNI